MGILLYIFFDIIVKFFIGILVFVIIVDCRVFLIMGIIDVSGFFIWLINWVGVVNRLFSLVFSVFVGVCLLNNIVFKFL